MGPRNPYWRSLDELKSCSDNKVRRRIRWRTGHLDRANNGRTQNDLVIRACKSISIRLREASQSAEEGKTCGGYYRGVPSTTCSKVRASTRKGGLQGEGGLVGREHLRKETSMWIEKKKKYNIDLNTNNGDMEFSRRKTG